MANILYKGKPGAVNYTYEIGAPGNTWSPILSSPAVWFDAQASESVIIESSKVATWNDISGNNKGAFQGSSSLRPTLNSTGINGNPAINFDGTTHLIHPPAISNPQELSVAMVCSGGNSGIAWAHRTSTTELIQVYQERAQFRSSANVLQDQSVAIANTFPNITFFQLSVSNSSHYMAVGGEVDWTNTTNFAGQTFSASSNYIGATNNGPLIIVHYTGVIGEIIVFTSFIDTTTRQKIEGYLAHKWDLLSRLPLGHPYISLPPSI
jgi:hypothetical protein